MIIHRNKCHGMRFEENSILVLLATSKSDDNNHLKCIWNENRIVSCNRSKLKKCIHLDLEWWIFTKMEFDGLEANRNRIKSETFGWDIMDFIHSRSRCFLFVSFSVCSSVIRHRRRRPGSDRTFINSKSSTTTTKSISKVPKWKISSTSRKN